MYEKVDGKLKYTEEKVVTIGLDELTDRKAQIEVILKREADKYQAELDLYQPQLDEVNTLIAEAEKLSVPSMKAELAQAEAMASEAVIDTPVEEVTIKE